MYDSCSYREDSNVDIAVSSELALHALGLSLGERAEAVIVGIVHVVVYSTAPVSIVS